MLFMTEELKLSNTLFLFPSSKLRRTYGSPDFSLPIPGFSPNADLMVTLTSPMVGFVTLLTNSDDLYEWRYRLDRLPCSVSPPLREGDGARAGRETLKSTTPAVSWVP